MNTQINEPGYEKLGKVLQQAFWQAASGKGKERHAQDGVAFDEQPMSSINRMLGSVDGFLYQAIKKAVESKRLPVDRAIAELYGSINYLAGAIIALERDRDAVEGMGPIIMHHGRGCPVHEAARVLIQTRDGWSVDPMRAGELVWQNDSQVQETGDILAYRVMD